MGRKYLCAFFIKICGLFSYVGISENHGQRFGEDQEVCEEVHDDEGKYSSSLSQDSDIEITECHGRGNERMFKSHAEYEQVNLN